MRWLLGHPGPHFSVHDVYEGWIEGLRDCGEQVFTFNLGDRITFYDAAMIEVEERDADGNMQARKAMPRGDAVQLAAEGLVNAAMKCWPHVILAVSAFFYPTWMLDLFRSRGMKVVLLHTECPYQDDEQLDRAAHSDINLLNDPVSLPRYAELGPAAYMPHAYRPSVHYPAAAGTVADYDLAFVGTGFPSRVQFFDRMNLDGLKVKLAGPWEDPAQWADFDHDDCIDNTETAGIYRQSRAGINLYRREGEQTWDGGAVAMGPREVEMAACGLFFLRDPRPEGDQVLDMLPRFTGPGDASDQLRWWLAHDLQRESAARKAREAIEGRTFASNARALMRMIEKEHARG
jgi:hypothetical protein